MATHRAEPVPRTREGTSHGRAPSRASVAGSEAVQSVREAQRSDSVFPLVVIGAGAIMLYSAVANVGITTLIRDLIAGKDPRKDVGTGPDTITATRVGGTTPQQGAAAIASQFEHPPTTATTNVPGPAIAGSLSHQFATLVLKAINAPLTTANYNFLVAWSGKENTKAANNPLATTTPVSGATPFNTFGPNGQYHVWNYATEAIGALATAKTLLSGRYNDILRALRSGHPSLTATYPGLHTWSGGAYSSVV